MGVKRMLEQGVANEQEQLAKVSKSTEPIGQNSSAEFEKEAPAEVEVVKSSEPTPQPKNTESSTQKEQEKKKPGRPTNEEKGIKSRKQYTLTLKIDTYKMILDEARKEEISFAKFMERAALEYIKNHN